MQAAGDGWQGARGQGSAGAPGIQCVGGAQLLGRRRGMWELRQRHRLGKQQGGAQAARYTDIDHSRKSVPQDTMQQGLLGLLKQWEQALAAAEAALRDAHRPASRVVRLLSCRRPATKP